MRTDVFSRTWTWKRVLLGRACCMTNGTSGIDGLPVSRWPTVIMVWIARHASSPPRALTLLATICSAVSVGPAIARQLTALVAMAAARNQTAIRPALNILSLFILFGCGLLGLGRLFHDQSGYAHWADRDVDQFTRLDDLATVGKCQPILPSHFRGRRPGERSGFLDGRSRQLRAGLARNDHGCGTVTEESFRLFGIDNPETELQRGARGD